MGSIVDTGSTDNTEEVIMTWSKENGVPITVHHEPFLNFSHNRTHSVRAAKAAYPDADYFLLSDADFVWEIKGKFDNVLLIDHKYLVEQYNKSLTYFNVRLLSAKVNWECRGRTHEFWAESKDQGSYGGEIRTHRITTLRIDDREDGGCKADKFERDERLLREGLDDPDEPADLKTRYKFYLGQTLKDMGRFDESTEWYTQRCNDKGWAEELYYAKFQIGYNYEQLGWRKKHAVKLIGQAEKTEKEIEYIKKWNPNDLGPFDLMEQSTKHFTDASVSYLAAYNFRKSRAEALYYAVRMHRLLGMNEVAYNLAQMGSKIPYPDQDTLFIERGCYDYLFDFEISIVAWYLPNHKDQGLASLKRLIVREDLPEWIQTQVKNNSRHYV
jgi:glycosyltransferase involved in cell wall biosynthesis